MKKLKNYTTTWTLSLVKYFLLMSCWDVTMRATTIFSKKTFEGKQLQLIMQILPLIATNSAISK